MIWALLAGFLLKRPPWVQALVLGLCTGLFVATGAMANQREPLVGSVALLVLTVGIIAGGAFVLALRAQLRHGWTTGTTPPRWVSLAYAAVWVLSVLALLRALFGAGGLKVAVLAIVPIVLLAPAAIAGVRALLGRPAPPDADAPRADAP
jgi:hypothetical protein